MAKGRHTTLPPPYLKRVWLDADGAVDRSVYPFSLPLYRGAFEIAFDTPATIIVGENGVGKSTLIEGIAVLAGFDEGGGGPGYRAIDHSRALERGGGSLAAALRASWLPKVGQGWFFRAESFFSVARYLDESGSPSANFLSHSHGEGFMRCQSASKKDPLSACKRDPSAEHHERYDGRSIRAGRDVGRA